KRPHVVLLMAEDEYKTEQTLPEFALKYLGQGFRVSQVFGSDKDRNNIPGLDVLDEADVLLVSVRRRVLPKEQLDAIRKFVKRGKPVVGIRTASHAFSVSLKKTKPPEGLVSWEEFDHDILGGNYTGHHGDGPKVALAVARGAAEHPILAGVDVEGFKGCGSLYKVSPLAKTAIPLLIGSIEGKPSEPVAWVNRSKFGGRVYYTSLGHRDDFKQPAFNLLLRNGIAWAAGQPPSKPTTGR